MTTYTGGQVSQVEQLSYGYDNERQPRSALDEIGAAAGSWTSQTLTEYLNDSNNAYRRSASPAGDTELTRPAARSNKSLNTRSVCGKSLKRQLHTRTASPGESGNVGLRI